MAAWGRLALITLADHPRELADIAERLGYVNNLEALAPDINESIGEATQDEGTIIPPRPKGPDELQNGKITPTVVPPAIFVHVIERRFLEQNDTPPKYIDGPQLSLQAKPGTYQFSPPAEIMPLAKCLPLLINELGVKRQMRRVDTRRLTKTVASGGTLKRIPKLSKQRWPSRLHVVIATSINNEPYWRDFANIAAGLKKVLGSQIIDCVQLDISHEVDDSVLCRPWLEASEELAASGESWSGPWQPPIDEAPILLLSDLGVDAGGAVMTESTYLWRKFFRRLNNYRGRIICLNPAPNTPNFEAWPNSVACVPINDGRAMPRYAFNRGYDFTSNAGLEELLGLLAYLPLIDVGLVRKVRRAFNLGSSDLEGLFWSHSHVQQGGIGCRVSRTADEHQKYYDQYIRVDSCLHNKLWDLVEQHHFSAFEGLKKLETFVRFSLVAPASDAQWLQFDQAANYLKQLVATGWQSSGSPNVAPQCGTFYQCLPVDIWQADGEVADIAYGLFVAAHRQQLVQGEVPTVLPQGFRQEKLAWLAQGLSSKLNWTIAVSSAQGEFAIAAGQNVLGRIGEIITTHGGVIEYGRVVNGEYQKQSTFNPARDQPKIKVQPNEIAYFRSDCELVTLEGFKRPQWADRVGYDDTGLYCEKLWCGEVARAYWQEYAGYGVDSGDSQPSDIREIGYWDWQSAPLGEDSYGLFADLEIDSHTYRFRWINPGTFVMGSPKSEAGREDGENQHPVTLSEGFWLGETVVSQSLWQSSMGNNPSRYEGEDKPVERVIWDDCQQFIAQLNKQHPGLAAALPTEAQWEYACRASTTSAYSAGEAIDASQANFDESGVGETCTVKNYAPNPWGLYQMPGNVWEWCEDWLGDYPLEPQVDPEGPTDGALRVLRGGSWAYDARHLRSAYRRGRRPDDRRNCVGLRLALGQGAQGAEPSGLQDASGSRGEQGR
ncbi:formylglycine-generating enzyme family protein [Marinagarivorans cellulosilyticus]|uniref:Sulfatase-modifying factor enzyme-like domain-containing protein n=1 Tax=Marinagarivorans cellulosilyticus TaxID=2721545 RepID=A0AAN2BIY8_9GAMM|nr:formylglycine-generating enzyme family protein [Marinagarivorans cellulosilyticus]BCD96394.1 hypothetical protein MARGE09_P0594 [Marinagarivorans cellulosilyticus]